MILMSLNVCGTIMNVHGGENTPDKADHYHNHRLRETPLGGP